MVLLGTVHTVITIIKAHWLYGPETGTHEDKEPGMPNFMPLKRPYEA
jgi:hypothetical protein